MSRQVGRLVRRPPLLPDSILWEWKPAVPYIDPATLGSSIFLYGSESDAYNGAHFGGSGVLLGMSSEANPSRVHLYAVSNAHVIDKSPVIRLVDEHGEPWVLPGSRSDWIAHPGGDDVAVCPLGAVPDADYWYVGVDDLLTPDALEQNKIGPGDDCLMVGRYINRNHRQIDRPSVRFGNLSMLPEAIYQKDRSFEQESFLVDMRSQSGYSGAPVFVYFASTGWRHDVPPVPEGLEGEALERARFESEMYQLEQLPASGVMAHMWVLGLEWGHLYKWGDVLNREGDSRIGRVEVSSGMAAVVPAWKILDILNGEALTMARDKTERQLAQPDDEGGAALDSAQPDEFSTFEDLTRKLVRVPKSELDDKRREV